jgi:hypothetical protein
MTKKNFFSFDWVIKYMLRDKTNYVIVEGFLSELLKQQIKIQEILESEENKETAEDDPLQPVAVPFVTAHQGGLNFSRAWGLWALYIRDKQRKYKEAYQAHIAIMMDNTSQWANHYYQYGHWVGQFGLFALRVKDEFPLPKENKRGCCLISP